MKETRVHEVFDGGRCPRCGFPNPYELSDNRLKCRDCSYKYSLKKINDDFYIWSKFFLRVPAYKASKDLGFSYNKVYWKYREYRTEISEYSDKTGIPNQPSFTDIRKSKEIIGDENFCNFVKQSLNLPGKIEKKNIPLYQRELEFRYHYRELEHLEFYNLIFKIHFKRITPFLFR